MLKQNVFYGNSGMELFQRISSNSVRFPRRAVVALILLVALFAFELFNFDTTRYALTNLLGHVSFVGVGWASILAVAFCAIDFAGLIRMFTPESADEQPKEVWYLMGAWLLGATMNALMTWWAVSLTLLSHEFGNEVLSRGQLLQIVPIFVATLVWLTRILFIGALTVTGGHLIHTTDEEEQRQASHAGRLSLPTGMPLTAQAARDLGLEARDSYPTLISHQGVSFASDELPAFLRRRVTVPAAELEPAPRPEARAQAGAELAFEEELPTRQSKETPARKPAQRPIANGRVRQRPPMPGASGFHARSRGRN